MKPRLSRRGVARIYKPPLGYHAYGWVEASLAGEKPQPPWTLTAGAEP